MFNRRVWTTACALISLLAGACKHSGGGSRVAEVSGSRSQLVDQYSHKPMDPTKEFYVFWLPYNSSPAPDDLLHTDIHYGEIDWVSYSGKSFLLYLNGLNNAHSPLPEGGGFKAGDLMLVQKQNSPDLLYLKWNSQERRFDNSGTVELQTLHSFENSDGLTPAAKIPLFIVGAATGSGRPPLLAAYAGELSSDLLLRQGQGILATHGGSVAVGRFDQGQLNGMASVTTVDGVIYDGTLKNDTFTGDFKVTFPSGNTFMQTCSGDQCLPPRRLAVIDEVKAQVEVHYLYGDKLDYGETDFSASHVVTHPFVDAEEDADDSEVHDNGDGALGKGKPQPEAPRKGGAGDHPVR